MSGPSLAMSPPADLYSSRRCLLNKWIRRCSTASFAMNSRVRKFLLLTVIAVRLTGHAQIPEPQIAGRVTRADDGTPIAGATVTLTPPFVAGILNVQTAKTDSNGDYRFEQVKDGSYTIEASADGFVWQTYRRDNSPDSAFQTIHASTRLTGIDFRLQNEAIIRGVVINAARQPVAAGIHVAAVRKEKRPDGLPASERNDVRITVERETRYRVTVWPSGPEGGPQPNYYDVNLLGRSHSSYKEHDGSYVIPNVPPGHYELQSIAWSESQYLGAGETSFEVSDKDVTVHVHLGGLGEIGGVVKWPGTTGGGLTDLMIAIESQEGAAQGSKLGAGGRFAFARVLPGHYKFRLLKNPANASLRDIHCGGITITDESRLEIGDRQRISDCELILENVQR